MVQDKVAKTDRGKACGALMRRAVNEVPNGRSITNSIREASIAIWVFMLGVRKLSLRQGGVISNKL